MKFTFKTEKPKGKWKSFSNPYHIIKLNGKQVGSINHENLSIMLMVYKKDIMEDGNPNCNWKNIILKSVASSLEETKIYLNKNFDKYYKLNLKEA